MQWHTTICFSDASGFVQVKVEWSSFGILLCKAAGRKMLNYSRASLYVYKNVLNKMLILIDEVRAKEL